MGSHSRRPIEQLATAAPNEPKAREPMFPTGYCDVASFTLARILLDEGYRGVKLVWLPNMEHWLVKAEGYWVDLTTSQFYDGSGE